MAYLSETWTCHVCGDRRPDERISVHKSEREFVWGTTVTENVRYCNDRPACREGAATITFLSEPRP